MLGSEGSYSEPSVPAALEVWYIGEVGRRRVASGIGAVPEGVWGIWACVNEFFPYQVSVVEEVEDRRQRWSLGDARGNGSPRLFEPWERQHSVPVPQEAAQPADHPVRDPSFA